MNNIRKDVNSFYETLRLGLQFHLTYHSVPVTLRLVGHAMRILSYANILYAVVNLDGDFILCPNLHIRSEVIFMRNTQRHLVSHFHVVDKHGSFDMWTFQEKNHSIVFPRFRDIDSFPIPCRSYIVFGWSKEERKLHLSFHPIAFHVRIEIERRVIERTCPLSIDRYDVALSVCQHRTRQLDMVTICGGRRRFTLLKLPLTS